VSKVIASFTVIVIAATGAFAHSGEPLRPHDLWVAWEMDPGILIPLVIGAVAYGTSRDVQKRSRRLAFWAGWMCMAVALISPLHALGSVLFSAHMVQHEILMVVAAPLLAFSRPGSTMMRAVPRSILSNCAVVFKFAHSLRPFLTSGIFAWSFHAIVLWAWHIPALYAKTLESDFWHATQHLSFVGSAWLFWWVVFYRSDGTAVFYLFSTAVHSAVLGALLTFARVVYYPSYAQTTLAWGLTPLEDQQLAGLIMWVPAGLTYIGVGVAVTLKWMRASEVSCEAALN
jgi:putative membrane protein